MPATILFLHKNPELSMKLFPSIICFAILFSSCTQDVNHLDDYLSDYTDIVGRQIKWDNISFHTTPASFSLNNIKGKKLVCLIGASCLSCIGKINNWNEFLKTNKFPGAQVLFIAAGPPGNELTHYLAETNQLSIPLLIDSSEKFIQENNLAMYYQNTFLLDENNKVIMIGDPLKHKNVYDYYQHLLTKN
jgi:hypothetical protein